MTTYDTVLDFHIAHTPTFTNEEHIILTKDDSGVTKATTYLSVGNYDLTSFWADCAANPTQCTMGDYTTSDWDGDFVALRVDIDADYSDNSFLICMPDSNCLATDGDEYNYYMFDTPNVGAVDASNPAPDSAYQEDYSDLE